MLYAFGDDEYNLLVKDANWFLFHEPLMITFFFLLSKNLNSSTDRASISDLVSTIPFFLFLSTQTLTSFQESASGSTLKLLNNACEYAFIGLLLISIYNVFTKHKEKWLLLFLVPFTLVFIVDELSNFFEQVPVFKYADSYGVFLLSIFLFYFITFRLIHNPKAVLENVETKYDSSGLSEFDIDRIRLALESLMKEKKLYKNQKLTVSEVANELSVQRQHLSEILNVHLGKRFQDYLNEFRVEEFIEIMQSEEFKNYSLLGMAEEAGFSSKSTFNSTFKKLKGVTPSEYRKGL